jgi:hypothetical protein
MVAPACPTELPAFTGFVYVDSGIGIPESLWERIDSRDKLTQVLGM